MAVETPTLAPIENIPFAKITWRPVKADERKRDPESALKLADSILVDGLLNPIVVMEDPAKPGHYIGVNDWHRAYGCEKQLKWKEMPCRVISASSDDEIKSMTIAENLWRNPLDKNQRNKAIAEWHRIFEAKVAVIKAAKAAKKQAAKAQTDPATADPEAETGADPEAEVQVGPDAEVAAEGDPAADPEAPTNFAAEVAKATGMRLTTVKRSLKVGKAFSDDQSRILDEHGVSQDLAETMSNLPQEQRDDAVSLIASGMDPIEAIGEASNQDQIKTPCNRVFDARKGSAEDRKKAKKEGKADKQISDEDWLIQECGEALERLPESARATFRQHALLYRHTRDLRRSFANKVEPIVAKARKEMIRDGVYGFITRLVGMEHPKAWLRCGDCEGAGCDRCKDLGFFVRHVGGRAD